MAKQIKTKFTKLKIKHKSMSQQILKISSIIAFAFALLILEDET
jgi:hypothetical protein